MFCHVPTARRRSGGRGVRRSHRAWSVVSLVSLPAGSGAALLSRVSRAQACTRPRVSGEVFASERYDPGSLGSRDHISTFSIMSSISANKKKKCQKFFMPRDGGKPCGDWHSRGRLPARRPGRRVRVRTEMRFYWTGSCSDRGRRYRPVPAPVTRRLRRKPAPPRSGLRSPPARRFPAPRSPSSRQSRDAGCRGAG